METGHTDRDLFLRWWGDAWEIGNASAAWSKAVDGLTPEQAAWSPPNAPGVQAGERHSIWQIVEHMIFWRENVLAGKDGVNAPSDAELVVKNFPEIVDHSPEAWADTLRRFRETHGRIAEAVRDRYPASASALGLFPHDTYHIGQVCSLRAMLGFQSVE